MTHLNGRISHYSTLNQKFVAAQKKQLMSCQSLFALQGRRPALLYLKIASVILQCNISLSKQQILSLQSAFTVLCLTAFLDHPLIFCGLFFVLHFYTTTLSF